MLVLFQKWEDRIFIMFCYHFSGFFQIILVIIYVVFVYVFELLWFYFGSTKIEYLQCSIVVDFSNISSHTLTVGVIGSMCKADSVSETPYSNSLVIES